MTKMTRVGNNNRKRQRSELYLVENRNNHNPITTNCFRMLCLLTLSQVVLSALQYQTLSRSNLASTSSTSLQFSASGALHKSHHSALHVSFAETSSSSDSAFASEKRTSQDATIVEDTILPEWDLLPEASQQELKSLLSYQKVSTFDYPELFRLDELTNGHPLLFMSWAIMTSPYSQPILESTGQLTLLNDLSLSPTKFCNLVRTIEDSYQQNPYHNRIHATDVFQTLHALLQEEENLALTHLEHFSLLLAAILHDVGHDGTNNLLHVQKQTPLAVQFQNVSVLENYHVQVGLQALEASGLLSDLPLQEQQEIHQLVTQAILNTDMAHHHTQVQAYKSGSLSKWQQAMYLLHLCDISNPIKSSQLIWGDLVMEEFFQIGDAQKALGVDPTFDRDITDKVSIQQGFLKFMVLPAFEIVPFANPKIMEGLQANLDYWMSQEPASGETAKESPI